MKIIIRNIKPTRHLRYLPYTRRFSRNIDSHKYKYYIKGNENNQFVYLANLEKFKLK